jgi:carbohydrate-selective porin OprB
VDHLGRVIDGYVIGGVLQYHTADNLTTWNGWTTTGLSGKAAAVIVKESGETLIRDPEDGTTFEVPA